MVSKQNQLIASALPQIIYAAWVGREYAVTKITPVSYIMSSQTGQIQEYSSEAGAKLAWEQEVQEVIGWQKFYSQRPIYSLEDCDNDLQRQGWKRALQRYRHQLRSEREECYDAQTAWMG